MFHVPNVYLSNKIQGIEETVTEYTYDNLRKDVYRIATSLRNYGIGPGDTVCGFVPNTYDTLVAVFATAAVGAAWCSASVDFGPAGVLDRFRQVHPKVLFTVNHVTYKKKLIDQTDKINEIVKGWLLLSNKNLKQWYNFQSSQLSRKSLYPTPSHL